MDFFQQGIPLGRWFGITVVIHWLFLLYAANRIFSSQGAEMDMAVYMALLFGTVLVHEFGHALSCKAVGGEAYHIVLWPLGGIAFVQPPMRPGAAFITTACGPLVNAVFWPVFYFASKFLIMRHYGTVDGPEIWKECVRIGAGNALFETNLSWSERICFGMWGINQMLLLFNLIPAYPMDGGRLLQEILWFGVGYGRSLQIAGMVGTVAGAAFIVLGTGVQSITIPVVNFTLGGTPQMMLIIIGALCMMQSFAIFKQSQQIAGWRKN